MYKFRSIAALQPNPRRLTREKYYQKNATRMIVENSARYRNQAVAQREIPHGLASPAPSLPPVPKRQRKAEKETEKSKNGCEIASKESTAKAKNFIFRTKRERSETKAKDTRKAIILSRYEMFN